MLYLLFFSHLKINYRFKKIFRSLHYFFPFFLLVFVSVFLHKDFPQISATPWVLTYLRVTKIVMGNSVCKGFHFGGVSQKITGYLLRNPQMSLTTVKALGLISFPKEGLSDFLPWTGWRGEDPSLDFRASSQLLFEAMSGFDFDLICCVYVGLGS